MAYCVVCSLYSTPPRPPFEGRGRADWCQAIIHICVDIYVQYLTQRHPDLLSKGESGPTGANTCIHIYVQHLSYNVVYFSLLNVTPPSFCSATPGRLAPSGDI